MFKMNYIFDHKKSNIDFDRLEIHTRIYKNRNGRGFILVDSRWEKRMEVFQHLADPKTPRPYFQNPQQ